MRFSLRTMFEAVVVIGVALTLWRIHHAPSIKRGEILEIKAWGVLPDAPIDGIYRVEEDGSVSLGPTYGTVSVDGLLPEEARDAIRTQLETVLPRAEVSVRRTREDVLILLQATNRKLETELEQLKKRLAEYE